MIDTQPNEKRCRLIEVIHILPLPCCCPISGNPQQGSEIEISYTANNYFLEVASLKKYINTFKGGKDDVRSMEGMIQTIAQDCANVTESKTLAKARLIINPGQKMNINCEALPNGRQVNGLNQGAANKAHSCPAA